MKNNTHVPTTLLIAIFSGFLVFFFAIALVGLTFNLPCSVEAICNPYLIYILISLPILVPIFYLIFFFLLRGAILKNNHVFGWIIKGIVVVITTGVGLFFWNILRHS